MNTMASQLSEHLINDPYNYIAELNATEKSNNIFRKNPEIFLDFLEDWDFVQSLVDSFASPLREILEKNEIKVSFRSDSLKKEEDWINKQLKDMNLRKILIDSIHTIVYRGGFFKYLTYNKEENKFHLVDVDKPWKTTIVQRFGKPMGYLRGNKFVDYKDGVFAAYRAHTKMRVTLDKVSDKKVKSELLRDLGRDFDSEMESEITAYTHLIPRSVFYGQAQKLFQIYLNDFILQFLALKDSVRQDLVSVVVNSLPKKTVNTAKVVQSIEEALNQGSNILVQQDPNTLLNQVIYAMFNNVRVLPMVENYSAINKVELVDLKDKRAQLQAENEEQKKQVVNNLSIPEELQTGTGNRWEILSRSDKYLTAINTYVTMCDNVVKSCVSAMMVTIGRPCSDDEIMFTFINDTPLQSQMSRNKAGLYVDSIRDTMNAVNGVKAVIATGFIDPAKAIEDFLVQIQSWNLPFATSYLSKDEILKGMSDPNNPAAQLTQIEI